uniref:RNase H type-1 domain-containing protein n=1 Tax=Quercus lobata TaxID=97700 RepID=A0A7N2LQY1_QUELO
MMQSTTLLEDKLVWTAVANGKFSVKSAYHLARKGSRNGGESSDPSGMRRFWRTIWKAQVPNKEAMFESDLMVVYSALQGLTEPPSSIESVAIGTLRQLHFFCQTAFSHTCREGNTTANGLAKYAHFIKDFVTWMEDTLPVIAIEVSSDVNQIS